MSERVKRIEVDRELCIGVASCIGVAPEAYELDEEQIAIMRDEWKDLSDEVLFESAEVCPVKAIFLYDKNDKQVYP